MIRILLSLSLSLFWLTASGLVARQSGHLSLTVYTDDLAMVHEERDANVSRGVQNLVYADVAGSLIPSSVIPSFSGPKVTLYSQNYTYDLISLPSMLRYSIGQEVDFRDGDSSKTLHRGILLAAEPSVMVRDLDSGRIYTLDKPSQVLFKRVPPRMITRPSLVWKLKSEAEGTLHVDLKYLTKGLSWKSDYVLDLHRDALDLVGWITVRNDSGVSYPDARIAFLAGELHRVRPRRTVKALARSIAVMDSPAVHQEAFAGYHLYTIPFRETLADKEQKQIRFLQKEKIPYRRYGKAIVSSFNTRGILPLHFRQIVELNNSKTDGLGIPLPRGTVRLYSRDSKAESRFIGESTIANTPAGERIKLEVGTLFDVTGKRTVTRFVSRTGYRSMATRYTLHNRGKEALSLRIEERIPTAGNHISLKSSCSGVCSIQKVSAFVRRFDITLAPRQSYEFTSEFEVYK